MHTCNIGPCIILSGGFIISLKLHSVNLTTQVKCNLVELPPELCALQHLRLLDLFGNPELLQGRGAALAAADLPSLASCVQLGLRRPRWRQRTRLRYPGLLA